MNRCCICGKHIIGTSWICSKCAKEQKLIGKKFSDWPEWAKICKYSEWQERQREKRQQDSGYVTLSYGTFEDLEEFEPEVVDVF